MVEFVVAQGKANAVAARARRIPVGHPPHKVVGWHVLILLHLVRARSSSASHRPGTGDHLQRWCGRDATLCFHGLPRRSVGDPLVGGHALVCVPSVPRRVTRGRLVHCRHHQRVRHRDRFCVVGEVHHLRRARNFDHPRGQRRALHKWREVPVYHRNAGWRSMVGLFHIFNGRDDSPEQFTSRGVAIAYLAGFGIHEECPTSTRRALPRCQAFGALSFDSTHATVRNQSPG
mmetsp:Transcript_60480/g.179797  ORF Transcript_60480/g.179797 Transcript_60480/m.179797 type:complete len:231 (+) Transcript_60480:96-788(+)